MVFSQWELGSLANPHFVYETGLAHAKYSREHPHGKGAFGGR